MITLRSHDRRLQSGLQRILIIQVQEIEGKKEHDPVRRTPQESRERLLPFPDGSARGLGLPKSGCVAETSWPFVSRRTRWRVDETEACSER